MDVTVDKGRIYCGPPEPSAWVWDYEHGDHSVGSMVIDINDLSHRRALECNKTKAETARTNMGVDVDLRQVRPSRKLFVVKERGITRRLESSGCGIRALDCGLLAVTCSIVWWGLWRSTGHRLNEILIGSKRL
jgi:hypothetical protein